MPSVAVHTQRFARLCNATALSMGMPRLRQAYTPHPVVDQSAAHLRAYIDGSDAVSGRPFMQVVLDGLTGPLEDADLQGRQARARADLALAQQAGSRESSRREFRAAFV